MSDYGDDFSTTFGFLGPAIQTAEDSNSTASATSNVSTLDGNYHYNPLTNSHSTRLITLLPSPFINDVVEVELHEVDLKTRPEYEALSYTWGDARETVAIKCEGRDLWVTRNCEGALRHLRKGGENRRLWVDAICIDQSSIDERSVQVRNMGEIYTIAECVLVWLGPADGPEIEIFKFLSLFESLMSLDKQAQDVYGTQLYHHMRGSLPPPSHSTPVSPFTLITESKNDMFETLDLNPWFWRTWTLQEIALARSATVICGYATISWDILVFAVSLLQRGEKNAGVYGRASTFHSTLSHQIMVRKLLLEPKVLGYTISAQDLLAGHRMREGANLNRLNMQRPVTTMLTMALKRQATEAKDRVFGLYAILQRLDVPVHALPLPDYTREVAQIYREATRLAIEEDNSLWILNYVNSIEEPIHWSSWVPTWIENFAPGPLTANVFKAARISQPRYTFSPDGLSLTVRAKIVDSIMLTTQRSTWFGRHADWSSERDLIAVEEAINMIQISREWMLLFTEAKALATVIGANRYGDDFSHTEAFIRALLQDFTVVDDNLKNTHDIIHGFFAWQRYLSALNPNSTLPIHQLRASLPPLPTDLSMLSEPHRRCISTDEWTVHRGIQEDREAALFHNQVRLGMRAKTFFVSDGGRYGTATAAAKKGDRIVLVQGLGVPLTLRANEEGEGDRTLKVVGPAFVAGLMEGEGWGEEGREVVDLTLA
ncbi:HET-domain-containing protein [Lentithecium fluviatile CBS 122367]|uniref:HET-domain-containing protein n=1 Tax=Lentithecium fluviatile CBS 122367 TaxID=1168545 RepID=A0A6G1J5V5_9PLEO|nr:HET-domain-containing protein [Lentithecium fluviatile CBS 122367]